MICARCADLIKRLGRATVDRWSIVGRDLSRGVHILPSTQGSCKRSTIDGNIPMLDVRGTAPTAPTAPTLQFWFGHVPYPQRPGLLGVVGDDSAQATV